LHRLPAGTVMGVPGSLAALPALAGLLTAAEVDRVAAEPTIAAPAVAEDVDVASWVAGRMGRAVVDRLVEPLLGGVYAGHADQLSLQATVPALWQRAHHGGPLLGDGSPPHPSSITAEPGTRTSTEITGRSSEAAPNPPGLGSNGRFGSAPGPVAVNAIADIGSAPATDTGLAAPATDTGLAAPAAGPGQPNPAIGPVFAGIRGGVGRLALTLADRLRAAGVPVRTGVTVRGLRRTPTGWRLETGPASAPEFLDADAVILAVPPAAAARLLRAEVSLAAGELAGIETASVAVVAAAVPAEQLAGLTGSGLLIPPVEGTAIKAATFSSAKWAWISGAGDPLIVRMSLGRAGEEVTLQRSDEELTALALADLAGVLGRPLAPIDSQVIRWGGGLPQYAVGHLARIERVRAAVRAAGGLAICGAALDGVGIAACIGAADQAVADILRDESEK
jgi:oxygen-dependent protoporphyrinogen oxidase